MIGARKSSSEVHTKDSPAVASGYGGPVAMFATMLRRDQKRNGLRIARASWLVGVSVREYRELEVDTKAPDWDTYERVCEL